MMKVVAYCAASFRDSVARAAGVEPLLAPPWNKDTITPAHLDQPDLLYVKLHGIPGQPFWYGDHWATALDVDIITALDLSPTTVFIANCHTFQQREDGIQKSPMLQALLDAGAQAVVGGPGQNYAKSHHLHGADLLGFYFRIALSCHCPPVWAFRLARATLGVSAYQDLATADTLAFRCFTQEDT